MWFIHSGRQTPMSAYFSASAFWSPSLQFWAGRVRSGELAAFEGVLKLPADTSELYTMRRWRQLLLTVLRVRASGLLAVPRIANSDSQKSIYDLLNLFPTRGRCLYETLSGTVRDPTQFSTRTELQVDLTSCSVKIFV